MTSEQPAPSLRAARAGDAARIKQLVRGAHLNPLGLNWERFTVAEDAAGRIVGCVQYKRHGGALELASLVVDPAWRGQGVGRRLVAALQKEVEAPLWLMCASPLTSFYRRSGFHEVRARRAMPLYFRLIRFAFDLLGRLQQGQRYLAIMVWEG